MKHFITTITSTKPDKSGNRYHTLNLYQVKKNMPVHLGTYPYSYESDNQATMNALEKYKALPVRYFARHISGGHRYDIWGLESEGVASVTQI